MWRVKRVREGSSIRIRACTPVEPPRKKRFRGEHERRVYGRIVELRGETSTASNEPDRRKRAVARSKHGNRVRAPSRSRMNQMRETVREQRELAPRNPYTRTVSVDYVRVYEQTGMRAVRLMRQYASMSSTATRPEAGVDDAPSPPLTRPFHLHRPLALVSASFTPSLAGISRGCTRLDTPRQSISTPRRPRDPPRTGGRCDLDSQLAQRPQRHSATDSIGNEG